MQNKAIVKFDKTIVQEGMLGLKPGVNLRTGERVMMSEFGQLTSLEVDLLTLASSIYACDIAFKRGEREEFTRSIKLIIPVTNIAIFKNIRDDIVYSLYKLSDDIWNIEFINRPGVPEKFIKWPRENEEKVLLFSGGLDSFAAAMQLGYSKKEVSLVSHITANQTVVRAMNILSDYLDKKFPGRFSRRSFRIGGINKIRENYPFPTDLQREDTQRTRSFLFLVLAGIVARRIGSKEIIMIAENGQLAIHLPLTAARISAFSTHTAHPEFISIMSNILKKALSYDISIENPFIYTTKAEVVSKELYNDFDMVKHTISCWRSARLAQRTHCGTCIPCIIRRIANEFNGIMLDEFNTDIFSEDVGSFESDNEGKRNIIELAEFISFFKQSISNAEIINQYPELVNEQIDSTQAINMYRRFAEEARRVFDNYPHLSTLVV